MKAPEYSPRHSWTSTQIVFLCVLWRWFVHDRGAFAEIFNAAFGLSLQSRKIQNHFENNIRLFGGKAFREYHEVFERTSFPDPGDRYSLVRSQIEMTAEILKISIQRLKEDIPSPSGKAEKAKSPQTRRRFRQLVRLAKKTARETPSTVRIEPITSPEPPTATGPLKIGGFPVTPDDSEAEDIFPTIEDLSPVRNTKTTVPSAPRLLFRVWDSSSRTEFSQDGFMSSAFKAWTEIMPPIHPDNPAFKLLAHLHLSKIGDTPCFVAAAESLVQVLTIAASLKQPQIAMINPMAPCMLEEHKIHHAAETLKWLKHHGKVNLTYRYQGYGDWFSWATIPNEAILKHFDLEELQSLCEYDDVAANLLVPCSFQKGRKTRDIATAMRNRHINLDASTARAMGRVTNLFLGNTRASTQHISAMVARLVDGWGIEKDGAMDAPSMSLIAKEFATNFGKHGDVSHQQLRTAFLDGVEEGTRCVARWSKPTARHKRATR